MGHDPFGAVKPLGSGRLYSLPRLEEAGLGEVSSLPVCLRIILESVLRNLDERRITARDVRALASWEPRAPRKAEIPFVVARILLQDFTGVPLLVDLAAMRSAVSRMGRDPRVIEPNVRVDLVVDHSVQVDFAGIRDALERNMEMELRRNRSRYEFLRWGTGAFRGWGVIPPGVGICHQVNLEHLSRGVLEKDGVYYPDTLVGTDSHTTMVNGLGIVGWGVGGIEAEAGMLGQPISILLPDVVGVEMVGSLAKGVTATDLVLHVTEMLRCANVVGKLVEFHGEGAATLTVPDRATISNMSPEYGATLGYFPVDEETCRYFSATGRAPEHVDLIRSYFREQGMFGMPRGGACRYTEVLRLDLASVRASVSGPGRPQDRIDLPRLGARFRELLGKPRAEGGYEKQPAEAVRRFVVKMNAARQPFAGGGEQAPESVPDGSGGISEKGTSAWTETEMMNNRPTPNRVDGPGDEPSHPPRGDVILHHGSVLIAAITSCTNTSNPGVMLAAGILARKAVERGLTVPPWVKASLAPGSRVVTDYLERSGLQASLDALRFHLVGYGCTTCIGNSGPLDPHIEDAITKNDVIAASVLSGNRNFEARIHGSIRANFLMSPPLVVAFALAGRVDIDLTAEPLGRGKDGKDVFLADIWPEPHELEAAMRSAVGPEAYRRLYANAEEGNDLWKAIPVRGGAVYDWDPDSTYIREPPYFDRFAMEPAPLRDIRGARALAIFGDSVTTDHISPAGSIRPSSPAGAHLVSRGVDPADFNSYGSRRGNHEVMVRGTFANVRIRNLMAPGTEGGVTVHVPGGERLSIYDAAMRYEREGVPLVVLAGREYGTGSSRDWAAKGTRLLGVRAVIARSFERIHRSNLIGMGVLPCRFPGEASVQSLRIDGSETFEVTGLEGGVEPGSEKTLKITRRDGHVDELRVTLGIETPIEAEYYRQGGILPHVLRQILRA